jgi:hypothetical protein
MKNISRQSDGTHNTHYVSTANSVFNGCRMHNTSHLQTKKSESTFLSNAPPLSGTALLSEMFQGSDGLSFW